MTLNIALFSGGRGTTSIVTALLKYDQASIVTVVNAYDDGLSTGRIRKFVKGMLGPSDIRKNITNLMPSGERCDRALRRILEYRFPLATEREAALQTLRPFAEQNGIPQDGVVAQSFAQLSMRQIKGLSEYTKSFLGYEDIRHREGAAFDYGDCSIGNIIFAGCFLANGRDFNKAIDDLSELCEVQGRVLNATDGENLVLVGLDEHGVYLPDEAAVVSPRESGVISDIYLLDRYLDEEEAASLKRMQFEEKRRFLSQKARIPRANPAALKAIESADVIIYGPGTQHSSLFPTYLTDGVAEALARNHKAEKFFVANIKQDHDIVDETVGSLLAKFLRYANRYDSLRHSSEDFITKILVNTPEANATSPSATERYVTHDLIGDTKLGAAVQSRNWEAKTGRHLGGMIVGHILQSMPTYRAQRLRSPRHMVSIVVPVLNEERTLDQILKALVQLDLTDFDLESEVIVVDGGSSDRSLEIAGAVAGVRVLKLPAGSKRGEVFRFGIHHAKGDIVVMFPADNEYMVGDVRTVVEPIVQSRYSVVFGSRAIKCWDLEERIKSIYGSDRFGFLVSKYGGMLISVISLFLYNRYVTDPLSTLKAYDLPLLERLALSSKGLDLEGEIIAKLSREREFILEVPVAYEPRPRGLGKKTSVRDGLTLIGALFKHRFATAVAGLPADRK